MISVVLHGDKRRAHRRTDAVAREPSFATRPSPPAGARGRRWCRSRVRITCPAPPARVSSTPSFRRGRPASRDGHGSGPGRSCPEARATSVTSASRASPPTPPRPAVGRPPIEQW